MSLRIIFIILLFPLYYVSIPYNEGLLALYYFLEKDPHPTPSTINLPEMVLILNFFKFNGG